MLRILGSNKRLCDGITRRDLMHIGALAGLGQASTVRADRAAGFGQAKRCILLQLWGSPSQLDTFDPKPDAPAEIRGDLGSIATAIPGTRIGAILPRTAGLLDKICVLRSLTHIYPVHGVSFATTGVPVTDIPLESVPRDPRQWPFVGSVVDHLAAREGGPLPLVPRNFAMPFPFGSKRGPSRAGPFGGFLGPTADPIWSEFRAPGTRTFERDSNTPGIPPRMVADPYAGMAITTSGKLRDALDVQSEPMALRERYGMNLFGQSCLAARRVLEAGGRFVTVFWDEYGQVNSGWDTHVHHNSRLKDELGPGLDAAFSSLIVDLEARGMLADTAIVVQSEHGRTPRMQNVAGGGRDHWAGAYSAAFAGGGFATGRVVGRTDRIGGTVTETAFSPKDVLATLYHVLGIDPFTEIYDKLGRPLPVGGIGRVRQELLA
ncbi:MAG: DUF1501 domain-containing protein [Planctomycetota bacterium]|nr:DUF1501 domain-containing protein [Planctomycetota bacterium]